MQTITLSAVKPGEFIKRTADAKATYIKGPYDRASKAFCCTDTEDISRSVYIKATKPVVVGFTY